ncbi:hypothetical protein Y032_0097g3003 [Ancylostoma ceylanicum]|uniref:PH domain-containing protein n=1 Tax=Ancylostoma ceylanicum TaxID=53326 RepID=A0A016TJM3_9BILA|nr:hypothetical protein Y032_0097g3003 [Ancylostoma ceylanicum]
MSDEEENNRWIERLRDILNQPDPPKTNDFDDERKVFGAVDALDVNTGDISVEETEAAIRSLRNKKAPGLDEIPPELLKAGGRTMAEQLTRLFNDCWRQAKITEEWRKEVIVKLPKKGDASECGNWRGITLLSVPGKTFCMVLLRHLRGAIDDCAKNKRCLGATDRVASKFSAFATSSSSASNTVIRFV